MIKPCVTSYSFGWDESQKNTIGLIRQAADLGFEAMEFIESEVTTPEKAHLIREECEKYNITPVAFCVGADFAKDDKAALDEEIKRVCSLVDVAEIMGVSMFRHDVAYGKFNRKYAIGYDSMLPFIAGATLEVTKYAEQKGIKTMTENHGFYSQDANRVEKLINTVAHPNFGALVDIGNFMCADEEPTVSVGIMAPYAVHVHCKDFHKKSGNETDPGEGWFHTRSGNFLRGCVIGHGDAKSAQSIKLLKDSGYDGYMTIEYEGGEAPEWGLRVSLDNLKRFLGE